MGQHRFNLLEASPVSVGEASRVWTIYCHTHVASGRRYVGLTKKTWRQRWDQHVSQARHARTSTCHWYNAIKKYGRDAFSHEVLEVCYSLDVANLAEECWIELLETRDSEKGFNILKGGTHIPGSMPYIWDRPGMREKTSIAVREAQNRPEVIQNLAVARSALAVVRSDPAYKAKASAKSLEVHARPDARQKLVDGQKKRREEIGEQAYLAERATRWQDPDFREKASSGLSIGTSKLRDKTHCSKGHERTPENLLVGADGGRRCRLCSLERDRTRKIPAIRKAQCPKGHALTGETSFLDRQGSWRCKTCNRLRAHAFYHQSGS